MEEEAQNSFGEIILNTAPWNLVFAMCFSTGVGGYTSDPSPQVFENFKLKLRKSTEN
jgi:hypothetical protein